MSFYGDEMTVTKPDFGELGSPLTFQRFCGDLLLEEGCCNMRGPGTGADQGADLLVDVPAETPLGRELVPYVIQCKWYASNRTVGADELGLRMTRLNSNWTNIRSLTAPDA